MLNIRYTRLYNEQYIIIIAIQYRHSTIVLTNDRQSSRIVH